MVHQYATANPSCLLLFDGTEKDTALVTDVPSEIYSEKSKVMWLKLDTPV